MKDVQKIRAVFCEALKKETQQARDAYIACACKGDPNLRQEVEALLESQSKANDFFKGPLLGPDVTLDTSAITEGPGTTIGNYKLLEQIGEGGMAVVYMAEQERPLRRRVALKIIKLGMDTKSVIARFEVERQALAVMDHPNIAKVFDAGSTETGRPYFVMELVRGVSITDYCDKNKLDTKERLNLFIQVCNAVQHAHQKGIIHRDIKPSNVMITLHDGKPVPKVIDFGIAKATSQRLTEKTLFTRYAQMIGTPAYMSPEQAEMSGLDIDTRTDIYSLGILLYELLTGVTPFSEKQLREAGYLEMQRIIREKEPLKPSTKLSTLGDTLTDVAEHRKASPDLLQKLVRGDLDWIVMKSLEKDRTRRYDTTAEMVADIARHINHEPVLAGPPSQIYRLRKFIRRHRTHAIGAAVVAVLLAGMTVISVMYVQAHNRGKEAEFLKHKDILSKAMEFRSRGQFQDALNTVEDMLSSKHVGPEARLLRGRLILELHGPVDAVKELEELIKEREEIASQAHLLLARIYLESDPGDPKTTKQYQQKAKEHQQEGEKLFSETAEAYFNQAMIVGTVKKTLECLNKAVELEPGHYPSRKARALAYYALRDYRGMERDAVAMTTLRDWDSLGYSLLAIALRETGNFGEAVQYHNKAIKVSSDEPELYDQRRRTHMQMANFELALFDARKCVELEPEKGIYHFHKFCALVASGRYDEAIAEHDKIVESGLMIRDHLDLSAAKYVSDTLDMGLLWYPPRVKPEGAAFVAMHEAAEIYLQLAKKAKRVVPEGFRATWSPDGRRLAYTRGVLGSSGIEILNLETGNTRLLTIPGFDPAWSPDGSYIAFTRSRQYLLLADLTLERSPKWPIHQEREVWITRADGTGEPEFLARGSLPHWSRDSTRVFFNSGTNYKTSSILIGDGSNPNPIIPCRSFHSVVSPNEEFVAYGDRFGKYNIVELATNSIVARWKVPLVIGDGLINWSPDGKELSMGAGKGLWIYNMKEKNATKVLSGSFGWCSWSPPDTRKIAIGRSYWPLHREIWVANLDPNVPTAESLGPGRTPEEHCQEMADFYTRRINFEPENAGYYLSRAECYMYLQNRERASADIEMCLRLLGERDHLATSLVTRLQENWDDADAVPFEVLACARGILGLENSGTFNYTAWLLATSPSAECRDGAKAVEIATKACELTNWKNANFIDTLAAAYAEAGEFDEAVKWQNEAIKLLSPEVEGPPPNMEKRLKLYQSGQPYRESSPEDR
ncbi:MAG: protein kinase [Phycisphaerae bacterium]|nr:protein kinase [Phycisphaerae bacterium]NIU09115.1 protein kinase [Phycisphaerae bacterium]NIU58188.1 protein kinase [Phycisphaerae bacterium]